MCGFFILDWVELIQHICQLIFHRTCFLIQNRFFKKNLQFSPFLFQKPIYFIKIYLYNRSSLQWHLQLSATKVTNEETWRESCKETGWSSDHTTQPICWFFCQLCRPRRPSARLTARLAVNRPAICTCWLWRHLVEPWYYGGIE